MCDVLLDSLFLGFKVHKMNSTYHCDGPPINDAESRTPPNELSTPIDMQNKDLDAVMERVQEICVLSAGRQLDDLAVNNEKSIEMTVPEPSTAIEMVNTVNGASIDNTLPDQMSPTDAMDGVVDMERDSTTILKANEFDQSNIPTNADNSLQLITDTPTDTPQEDIEGEDAMPTNIKNKVTFTERQSSNLSKIAEEVLQIIRGTLLKEDSIEKATFEFLTLVQNDANGYIHTCNSIMQDCIHLTWTLSSTCQRHNTRTLNSTLSNTLY